MRPRWIRVRDHQLETDKRRRVETFDCITRVLAERLQRREASEGLRAALQCGRRTDWEHVVARARREFVLPAFAAAMRDLDFLGSLEPKLRAFTAIAHPANIRRNSRLRDQLAAAVGVLNGAGIEPVLMKGAIRLVDGLYPDSGWRMMQDLDILVPEARLADAIGALNGIGYVASRAVESDRKDVKLRQQGLANLEIHRELFATARKQRLLQGAEVISSSRAAALDGTTVRLPSTVHQLVHLIGHSQIGHHGHAYGRIMLRDRLEAAAMMRWLPESVDWEAVFMRFAAAGYRRPLLAFLLSLNDGGLYAVPIQGQIDPLTAVQQRRIALQARSTFMTRVSLYAGWCVVLLKMQTTEHEAGPPKIVQTVKKLMIDHEERRRILRTFIYGMPRPW